MVYVGQSNRLNVVSETSFGYFLDGESFGKVLLAKKHVSDELRIGESVDVFLYFNGESELVATCEKPLAEVGQWALMTVESTNSTGAFVNWGIKEKDLLIPFSEQRTRLKEGQSILVYVYLNQASGLLVGTTKFNKWLDKTPAQYAVNQQVELLVAEKSELGLKVIINQSHWGMLFSSDVFGKIFVGKQLKGYIKQIREDGKIDVSLQKVGVEKMDDLGLKILQLLDKKGGFLPLNDKSSPEAIFDVFRASKGTFKKSIGQLYKQQKITIKSDGIYLNKK
ncbi:MULTISPECIES: S1 RNA-binding domain-containing protein [unclassified Vibrio]|uniref:S1-like domain-containing RNA-binding protein n=1 Tax=Vibrio sp. HB236076 TaxID=3232307 RepID=A0AB39HC11_9VIBR|nr:S1-like domain-containing RNA-binding protein [Vibrio sp. HB161653]MDP5253323.1 S1-like domain-containing RNA-binding protein [Vibrio sp. HB161653]